MLFAIRTIQERTGKDLGATFLSGTTISNSLTELYLLFKYLRPKELERQDIRCFDAWAAIFAKKTTDFEFNVTNNVVQKERFRYFIKVPELAAFYNEITDYRTAEDVGVDRPNKNEILHHIPPTPEQEDFIAEADAIRQDGRCHPVGQAAAFGNGRKGEDAHRHGLCPENGTRHAHDRPELRRSSRQQSEPLCQDDRGVLSKIRRRRKARSSFS